MSENQPNRWEIVEQFTLALNSLPGVSATASASEQAIAGDRRYDRSIEARIDGRRLTIVVEISSVAFPRDVRFITWAATHPSLEGRLDVIHVILAEYISPGAKELLRHSGVGYFDRGGSLYLSAPGFLVFVDRPDPPRAKKLVRRLFAGSRARVLMALLSDLNRWWGATLLSERASVSPSTASDVLSELERFEWLDTEGRGPTKKRRLVKPGELLDAWAKHQSDAKPPLAKSYFVPAIKSPGLFRMLDDVFQEHAVDYAVSFEAASQHYAPFATGVSQTRFRALSGPSLEAALEQLQARPVSEGANLAVIEVRDAREIQFRERVDGLWLASPIQVYLDLMRSDGRGPDMAKHLRHSRIGF